MVGLRLALPIGLDLHGEPTQCDCRLPRDTTNELRPSTHENSAFITFNPPISLRYISSSSIYPHQTRKLPIPEPQPGSWTMLFRNTTSVTRSLTTTLGQPGSLIPDWTVTMPLCLTVILCFTQVSYFSHSPNVYKTTAVFRIHLQPESDKLLLSSAFPPHL